MSDVLVFNDVQFDVLDRGGQPWIRSPQIAEALGYKQANRVTDLYNRNADEFTNSMTVVVTLPTSGGPQETRIFSLRGCHLLAMFSRTPVAKSFRVWVLDVLENLNRGELARPALDSTATPSTADDRIPLRGLVHAWAQASGVAHQALWPQVKAHFQLSRVDDLPVEWIPDALAFVQGKIDGLVKVKALPAPKPQPSPLQRMALDYIPRLRRLAHEFSETSDELFGIFARDDEVVQSLHLAAQLTNQSLVRHYINMAGRV